MGAVFIGFSSTWWVGSLTATVLIAVSLIKKQEKDLVKTILRQSAIIICFSICFGLIGGIFGYLFPIKHAPLIYYFYYNARMNNVQNYAAYFSVWMIHIFGYFGGLF